MIDTYWIFENIPQDKNGFTLWKKVVAGMSAGGKFKIAGKVFSKMLEREIDCYILWCLVCDKKKD